MPQPTFLQLASRGAPLLPLRGRRLLPALNLHERHGRGPRPPAEEPVQKAFQRGGASANRKKLYGSSETPGARIQARIPRPKD